MSAADVLSHVNLPSQNPILKARHMSQMVRQKSRKSPRQVTFDHHVQDTDHAPGLGLTVILSFLDPSSEPWVTTTGVCLL